MNIRTDAKHSAETCCICGEPATPQQLRPFAVVRPDVSALIAKDFPAWDEGRMICRDHLASYRRGQVEALLRDDLGELGPLERQVLESLEAGRIVSQTPEQTTEEQVTFGNKMADRVAMFGGSWTFILSFCAVLFVWISLNITGFLFRPFDPYPFILLNLVLSTVAAFQAPVIMMSQRRQEQKDRLRAENDYRVNLKAELEIRQLHEKIDHQLMQQSVHLRALTMIERETAGAPDGPGVDPPG